MRKLLCAIVGTAAVCASAQNAADAKETVKEEKSPLSLDGGFDLRFRYDWYDNLPNGHGNNNGVISPAYVDYSRLRTRVWGSAYYDNIGIYARLANEFRAYNNYAPSHNFNTFPDQLFVDSLYLDFKNLFDVLSIRIGRQDMRYGAGRVVADGTPGDGSRSAYFDAIKLSLKVTKKTTADLFATYTMDKDRILTLGDADGSPYHITSYDGATGVGTAREDKLEEWGLGTYWTVKEMDDLPMEFYLIYKGESRWFKGGKNAGNAGKVPGRNYVTAGLRLMPQFTDDFKGDFEAAYQIGRTDSDSVHGYNSQDINAFMLYGGLTYTANSLAMKPYGTLAALYLSGDDTDSSYDRTNGATGPGGPQKGVTGWNPVYGRYTYIGELPVKMYGSSYRWSNLIWPYAEVGCEFKVFDRKNAIKIQTGPMFADKDDRGNHSTGSTAAVSNGSLYRGWYTQATYECTFIKEMHNKRGSLKGRVQAEQMFYGDYYYAPADNRSNSGYFLRAELALSF